MADPDVGVKTALVVTTGFVPFPSGNGPGILTWGLLEGLKSHGVTPIVAVLCQGDPARLEAGLRFAAAQGIDCRVLSMPDGNEPAIGGGIRKLLARPLEEVYPAVKFGPSLAKLCGEINPDVLLAFSTQSLVPALAGGYRWPKRVLLCADLDHENRYYRFRHHLRNGRTRRRFYKAPLELWAIGGLKRHFVETIKKAEQVISFASHTADWMRAHGVAGVSYVPAPIASCSVPAKPVFTGQLETPRFLLVGGYGGLVTQTSMESLCDDILPALDSEFGVSGYQLHWVGSDAGLPARLARKFERHPAFIRRGFVEDLGAEYAQANAVLVPTPVAIGTRTRLAEAMGYGCAVVAHSSNLLPMRELKPGVDLLIADQGVHVAQACRKLFSEPAMAENMRVAARLYFDRYHSPVPAVGRILEAIAGGGNGQSHGILKPEAA